MYLQVRRSQEVGDHETMRYQLGAGPSGHLDIADHDSVRLLGHFTVSRLPGHGYMGHGTRAVVIVGGNGHESVNVTGHSSSGVMDGQLRASLAELKPEGFELPSSSAPTGLPPSTPANRTV